MSSFDSRFRRNPDGSFSYTQENGVQVTIDEDVCVWIDKVWLIKTKNGIYAGWRRNGKLIYLHREIMKVSDVRVVDHMNGNPSDNRRINLRVCSNAENIRNRIRLNKNNTSGKRGVYFGKRHNRWVARIKINRKTIWLGEYLNWEDAIAARRIGEIKHFGKFQGTV